MVEELGGADRPPELPLRRRPTLAPDDPLLPPLQVVEGQIAAADDADAERHGRPRHQEGRGGGERVDARVEDSAGMEVGPLVLQLVEGLEGIVADEMLDLQDSEDRYQRIDRIAHRLLPTVPN